MQSFGAKRSASLSRSIEWSASGKVGKFITDFPNENVLKMKNVVPLDDQSVTVELSENHLATAVLVPIAP